MICRTKDIAFKLREFFRKREVAKKYWVLTKGTPDPTEGTCIPIGIFLTIIYKF